MDETERARDRATRAADGGGSGARGGSERRRAPASEGSGVCPVAFCPICTAVSTMNRASPDVVEHLLLAGQEFLMALKAVVDARASDFDRGDGGDEPPSMQRIDIG